jgi:hypothetical protein
MYRILQSLEREPNSGAKATPIDPVQSVGINSLDKDPEESSGKRQNPRKYLLYRPTFAQLMLYIATCFKDITENSCLLLYISADGSKRFKPEITTNLSTNYHGGIATAVNVSRANVKEKIDVDQNALTHTVHPQDLVPFTRKALFLIVDSNNSTAFASFPKVFNQPFLVMMSPVEYPSTLKDTTQVGSLFTLFLHCPVKAFAFVSELTQIGSVLWDQIVVDIEKLERFIIRLLEKDATLGNILLIDKSFSRFIQDDFLAVFMARFVLMNVLLKNHGQFNDPKNLPISNPEFPKTIIDDESLAKRVEDFVKKCSVGQLYTFKETVAEAAA